MTNGSNETGAVNAAPVFVWGERSPLCPHVFPHTATQTGGRWPPLRVVFVMCGTRRQERCRAVAYLNTSSVCVRDKPTVCNGRFALPQGRLVVGAATGRPWKVSECSKPHEEERNMRRKKTTLPVGRTFAHRRCANGAAVPEGHAAAAPQAQRCAPPPQPEFPLPFL